jgi:hypothetical protein
MSDESPDDHEEHKAGAWAVSNFLTPPVCAIAALTLAIAALLDQNAVPVGFAAVLEEEVARPAGFYVVRGLVTVLQVAVVLLLARRSFAAASSLVVTLARAAVLISGIALVPAVLAILGGAI